MTYHVLARKWRPKNFQQLVGQGAVVQTLENALKQSRLHHAYLFTGTRGVGKTTIARIFAKCLSCIQGISATPCEQCEICLAIDRGQFIDLIEVDAASRTKVEDTRELLDNVQYAPSQGRFKIYLIDEVHMLSGHSFNALLKTLEEPPEHVKFLLATTDPQKLPITVLSRCLQFHLRGITPEIIQQQLAHILLQENVVYEDEALSQIAQVANGSLRDALSILDQAIAFSNQNITVSATNTLLNITPQQDLLDLLQLLADRNAAGILAKIKVMALDGAHFGQVLADLLMQLHRIACLQIAPTAFPNDNTLLPFTTGFSPEDIQLFYEIGLLGQRDFPYAPSPRSALEMTLLRMLTFTPHSPTKTVIEPKLSQPSAPPKIVAPVAAKTAVITKADPSSSGDWVQMVQEMQLTGMTKLLAQHCVFLSHDNNVIHLQLSPQHASFANDKQRNELTTALRHKYGNPLQLKIDISTANGESPAAKTQRETSAALQNAKNILANDPNIQSLLEDFGANFEESSIKLN
jgi:DNA polymerase-3 subunit gamma/tau